MCPNRWGYSQLSFLAEKHFSIFAAISADSSGDGSLFNSAISASRSLLVKGLYLNACSAKACSRHR
jgi:hypothetical protein